MAPPEGSDMTWLVMTTAMLNSSAICALNDRHKRFSKKTHDHCDRQLLRNLRTLLAHKILKR